MSFFYKLHPQVIHYRRPYYLFSRCQPEDMGRFFFWMWPERIDEFWYLVPKLTVGSDESFPLPQYNRNPGISFYFGEGNGEKTIRSRSQFSMGPWMPLCSLFPLSISFSIMNLKYGGLCLALQEFLKSGSNWCLEVNSQKYPSQDFGVLTNGYRYSVT